MACRYLAFLRPAAGLAMILALVTSCMPGREMAKSFTAAENPLELVITPPEFVYKFNHKGEKIPGFDSMPAGRQDSALWNSSLYMQFVSDSIILENYMNSFISELKVYGFKVHLNDTANETLKSKPQVYRLGVTQVQLDEYLYPLQDEDSFLDTVYYKHFDLNAVDLSCWFEIAKIANWPRNRTLLYSTRTAYDTFDGRFFNDPLTGTVRYRYSIDTLHIQDIYDLASFMGRKHAGYLYDLILNAYVDIHLPEGYESEDYYHYDPRKRSLSPAGEERFEIIENR